MYRSIEKYLFQLYRRTWKSS